MTRRRFQAALAGLSVRLGLGDNPAPAPACPLIDHLACKLPGELEPRLFDVFAPLTAALATGTNLPAQSVAIGNRDAPWHCAAFAVVQTAGTATLSVRVYNSRGFGISDDLLRAGQQFGGVNAAKPVNPSLVWPKNSSLVFDIAIGGAGTFTGSLFFYGFKIYDRGKAPC